MQLLRTIAIIVIIFYGFRLLARFVFPFFLKRWVDKKMGQFQNQSQQQFNDAEEAKRFAKEHEGEIKVKATSRKNKSTPTSTNTNDGEYVDFEEVE